MEHIWSSSDPWFEHIKSGQKIYEGRRWWAPTQKIKVGDKITFKSRSTGDTCSRKVKNIVICESFAVALEIYPLEDILPGVKSIADGVKIYNKYVSEKTQKEEGVCIIELLV